MEPTDRKTKIKYAKLRLFKTSTSSSSLTMASGSRSQPELQHEGINPKTPSHESIEQMEPECIDLSNSDENQPADQDEPIIKRTRLDKEDNSESRKLPKFSKKPSDDGGGVISKFFKTSEDDFEPAKPEAPPKAKTKAQRKATATRKPRAPRKPKNQADIRKVFQKYKDNDEALLKNLMLEHTLADRLDPDQFQLALAMSRSLVDQGGSQPEPSVSLDRPDDAINASSSACSLSSEERRLQGIRNTLEQYGFKCKNSYNDYDLNVIFGSAPKNVKKIKHKRPTMLIRREPVDVIEFMERQAKRLFNEQLEQRLEECDQEIDLNLRSYGSVVFWMSQNPAHSGDIIADYYVESLVEMSDVRAGYLLKNWRMIPGRECTPERRLEKKSLDVENEFSQSPTKNEGEELLEDPQDSLLDMNTVSEEYRQKYNNEVPLFERAGKETTAKRTSEIRKRSTSPDLFDSDSGAEEDDKGKSVKEDSVVQEELQPDDCLKVVEKENDDEEDKFLTAQTAIEDNDACDEAGEDLVRATSSENIFEDSNPMLDYDVYTSEEAKMISSLPEECTPRKPLEDKQLCTGKQDFQEEVVVLLSSTDDSNSNQSHAPATIQPIRETIEKEEKRNDTLVFPSPGKQFSFNGLAISHRLSEVLQDGVETIELQDDDTSEDEPENICDSDELKEKYGDDKSTDRTESIDDDEGINEDRPQLDKTLFPSPGVSFRSLSVSNKLYDDAIVLDDEDLVAEIQSDEKTEETMIPNHDLEQTPCNSVVDIYVEQVGETNKTNLSPGSVTSGIIKLAADELAKDNGEAAVDDKMAKGTPEIVATESTEQIPLSIDASVSEDDPDDVLVISDDEVNYSVKHDYSVLYNVSPLSPVNTNTEQKSKGDSSICSSKGNDDLDGTKVYFNIDNFKRLSSEVNITNMPPPEGEADPEAAPAPPPPAILSNEANKADDTMAFLDGLIKKFNLPTKLAKQSTCDESKAPDLADYMNNYEIPDFVDDPPEEQAPISSEQLDLEIEQILSQAQQACSQLQLQQNKRPSPLRRTTSDSALAGTSKRNIPKINKPAPTAKPKNDFTQKFADLQKDPAPPPVGIEIRLDAVSPRPDYERMASPLLQRELFKYGLKLLGRKQAVAYLNYIYDQTHPFVEIMDGADDCVSDEENDDPVPLMSSCCSVPELEGEECILPSKPRKKTFWCPVPLHIAFHNMVNEDPGLRRQMLRYQPIDLDAVYSHLKEIGLRYESNDLIAFLDKRCITFRTAQSSGSRTKKTSDSLS